MKYEIKELPKEEWKGKSIDFDYPATEYFDVEITEDDNAFRVEMVKKPFEKPFIHKDEGDFPAALFPDYWEGAQAFGIKQNLLV